MHYNLFYTFSIYSVIRFIIHYTIDVWARKNILFCALAKRQHIILEASFIASFLFFFNGGGNDRALNADPMRNSRFHALNGHLDCSLIQARYGSGLLQSFRFPRQAGRVGFKVLAYVRTCRINEPVRPDH